MAVSDHSRAARWPAALASLVITASLALVACGATSAPSTPKPTTGAFARLQAAPLPSGWRALHPHGSAYSLPLPPGFSSLQADPGAASAGITRAGVIVDYLNATPRQGEERPATWARFRVAHNREEGDRAVRALAATRALHFPTGPGACVEDVYRTVSHAYHELACLVRGARASTVVVAAALQQRWTRDRTVLERALGAFTT